MALNYIAWAPYYLWSKHFIIYYYNYQDAGLLFLVFFKHGSISIPVWKSS